MWFFMTSIYVMTFVTSIALVIAFMQSFLNFYVLAANHVTFVIFTCLLYFFTETLVIFFFVGTGVSIKEYVHANHLDSSYHQKSITIKRKLYPPLMLNLLIMSVAFVLVGALDTYRIPKWIYQIIFLSGIIHYGWVKIIQNDCFRENTGLILDITGIQRKFA